VTDPINPYPRRLIEEDSEIGRLLRQANKEFAPSPAWIDATLKRPLRAKRSLFPALPVAVAGTVACAAAVVLFFWQDRSDSLPRLSPETVASHAEPQVSPDTLGQPVSTVSEQPARAIALPPPSAVQLPTTPTGVPSEEPRGLTRSELTRPPVVERTDTDSLEGEMAPDSSGGEAARMDKPDCLSLVRSGETRRAESCFADQAAGQGLDAEVGLYELSRLRRDALGDTAGALRALEEHRRRFSSGALRAEVDASYVSLLVRVGRGSEALAESERLLGSAAGAERAYELRMLRGHLLRKSGSLALAQSEYAWAEQATGSRADASYYNGVCLQGLGRGREAASAYRRYLDAAPTGSHASEARRRLDELSGGATIPE